jgi:Uma2 family endonuclease
MTVAEAKPKTKLTSEDYLTTSDDERWELLDGELVKPLSPNTAHQTLAFYLVLTLGNFVQEKGLGQVRFAPYDVVLSNFDVLQPDVLFVSAEREHIISHENIQGAPDLVVEILSPSTASRDWRIKLDLYAEHGVLEYWVVDPDAQRVWVMTRREGALVEVGNYGREDVLASPILPGFSVSLDKVFSEPRRSA